MNKRIYSHSQQSTIPFTQTPEWNREIALAKADFLELTGKFIAAHKDEFGKTEALNRFLKVFNRGLIGQEVRGKLRKKIVKPRTYYLWRNAFKCKGLSGLLERYNNGGIRIPPEIREEGEKLVWQNHLCRYQDVYDDLEVIFQKKHLPCYTTIRNYVKKYKAENWAALVLEHEGQKGLRDRNMQVALGRMDEDLTEPNQRWEIDTTIADLFTERKVKDVVIKTQEGKRCELIGVTDVFSRSVRFYLTENETGLMVGQVIRDRILAWGIPEEIVIDNGKPYKNSRVLHFLRSIGVSSHICIPGNPEEKPHIERAFRTLTEKLFRRLEGYSGNSVANRPNEIEFKYTMSELQQIIDRWVINVYSETVHRSTGQRPRERMSLPGFTPKTIDERELDILLMEQYERTVRQGYITYQGGKYFHPKLPEGQKIKIRVNDYDASVIFVFVGRKFLCVAEDYRRKGKTPVEILAAKKERNRELRIRIKAHEALIDKQKPKDANILAIIDHHEKIKPVELPKKADVLEFPELNDIPYTKPGIERQAHGNAEEDTDEVRTGRPIRNNQEKYLNVMRRKLQGKAIDDSDNNFLEDFLQSPEYKMVGSYLDEQLQTEAVNER
ncbi:DDE-type integrase/transposase/recombinase [Thermodesulfobacteriota bacterium]